MVKISKRGILTDRSDQREVWAAKISREEVLTARSNKGRSGRKGFQGREI